MSKLPHRFNPTIHRVLRSKRDARSIDDRYAMYELRKAEWIYQNLGATPEQYEASIRCIKHECGV